MQNANQGSRHIAVFTPLPAGSLVLRRFSGTEAMSALFEYELEMLSENDSLDPTELVGHPISFTLDRRAGSLRYFHGIVRQFGYVGQTDKASTYRATVVPWLWLLTQTSDCRIFQKKNVVDIISQVFSELGFTHFDTSNLQAHYPAREYCVQYRESDFNFVSRLMEEEGIFYYFRHDERKHTLVLCDNVAAYCDLPESDVQFPEPSRMTEYVDRILKWEHQYAFRPGKWAQTDFDFTKPSQKLLSESDTVLKLRDNTNYELFDFPGRYSDRRFGERRTRIRMEENEAAHDTVTGASTYFSFTPGGQFTVATHRSRAEQGRKYVLTRVETSASVNGSYITGTATTELRFENRFTCIPADVVFRPSRSARKPIVEGPQTAVIVGPPGEEIYPDEYGRVKCQFHWDRYGKFDENSSCWIRVSQVHAGKGWGGIDLPRIGEEVIVEFLEGDPDQPIISGRVYNADNMPPFALPAGMTRSGMKSQTHKGQGSNEISMDDTAGQEQIRVNAQHNMDTTVNNNQSLIVNVDRTTKVGNNDTLSVGVDAVENVGNNKTLTVANNMNVDTGNTMVINAGASITLKCGSAQIHMTSGGVISITGTIITTAAASNATVAAPTTQVVGGLMLTTYGTVNMINGGVCHLGALGLASVAGGKVDIVASGKTSIKGGLITLN